MIEKSSGCKEGTIKSKLLVVCRHGIALKPKSVNYLEIKYKCNKKLRDNYEYTVDEGLWVVGCWLLYNLRSLRLWSTQYGHTGDGHVCLSHSWYMCLSLVLTAGPRSD
jgi:hypothetical protein